MYTYSWLKFVKSMISTLESSSSTTAIEPSGSIISPLSDSNGWPSLQTTSCEQSAVNSIGPGANPTVGKPKTCYNKRYSHDMIWTGKPFDCAYSPCSETWTPDPLVEGEVLMFWRCYRLSLAGIKSSFYEVLTPCLVGRVWLQSGGDTSFCSKFCSFQTTG